MGESIATVTVTFHPDIALLEKQLQAMPPDALKIVVDNASPADSRQSIRALSERVPGVRLIENDTNAGLAAALNRGVRAIADTMPSVRFVLLLDQDSEPTPGSVPLLATTFRELEAAGRKVGAVGPRLLDAATGLEHGFHLIAGWKWVRVFPKAGSTEPVEVDNLNGSGTLMPVALFNQLGGLEEGFFIDHVDTEWAFRLRASGYAMYGVPNSRFLHRMGDSSVRFWWFGWRVWPTRGPQRHYFLFRNAMRLLRRAYVPLVWKAWAILKLLLTAVVMTVTGPGRIAQLVAMGRGLRAGLSSEAVDAS